MKFEKKIKLVLVSSVFPYLCAVFALVFYLQRHPGAVPRWIAISLLCAMILTLVVGGFVISHLAKKEAARETRAEAKQRARASKGQKVVLIIGVLILLNAIRLILGGTIPWSYAIPGLSIAVLLIFSSWLTLKKLKKADDNSQTAGSRISPQ